MGKPTICICENKGADQLLLLCSPVCVGPGRKPQCWFSHEEAQIMLLEYTESMIQIFWISAFEPRHEKTRLLSM